MGSESLARALNRSMSSATLRNIMADLEKKGYLDHPHTSAGRLPTDEGYRVYVDSLMSHAPLPARDAAAIESELRPLDGSPTQVMETASQLLSRPRDNVGFVLVPDVSRAHRCAHRPRAAAPPAHPGRDGLALTGLVTNRVIEVEEEMSQDELQACANYLNAHFAGLGLDAIRARLLELMQQEKALYDSLLQKRGRGRRPRLRGGRRGATSTSTAPPRILDAPELEDLDRMRALFKTFEEKSRLVKILNACLSRDGVRDHHRAREPGPRPAPGGAGDRQLSRSTARRPGASA